MNMNTPRVAIVGATGAVGVEILSCLETRNFPLASLKLLASHRSAGKQVASSASYWNKGTDQANSIDLRIQRGLIDAATSIKSIDARQGVEIDNYGIHLRKNDPVTGAHDPEQGWITNNKFLYSIR